jgi:tRNA (cytidine56-2'-O)-methyltransferase
VCLTARAFGADGVVIADTQAQGIVKKVDYLTKSWGGSFWVKDSLGASQIINKWKRLGGIVVNLSMYGEDIRNVLSELYNSYYGLLKPILVIIGSSKVPGVIYASSDYNVSITHQPHSEIAALAIFLDRLGGGQWPQNWDGPIKVMPSLKGKGKAIYIKRE